MVKADWVGDHSWNGYERDRLFHNDGQGHFVDVSDVAGGIDPELRDGRGAALLDMDNDGDLDVVVTNRAQPPYLLENRVGNRKPWLKVRLVGTRSNRQAVGAQVRIRDGAYQMLQEKRAGSGFSGSSDLPLFFGLGQRESVPELDVRWPSGLCQVFHDVPADHQIVIVEGQPEFRIQDLPTRGSL